MSDQEHFERLLRETADGDMDALVELVRVSQRQDQIEVAIAMTTTGLQKILILENTFKGCLNLLQQARERQEFSTENKREGLYVVRQYDGFDYRWFNCTKPLPYDEAQAYWNKKTKNGTAMISYDDIDYYKIFPADTRMLHR